MPSMFVCVQLREHRQEHFETLYKPQMNHKIVKYDGSKVFIG